MNAYELSELYENKHEARQFFRWLASCNDTFMTLGVNAVEERTNIEYYDLVALFKDLDKIGAGEFIVGRKGHDSRMSWLYNTNQIAKTAMGEGPAFGLISKVSNNAIDLLDSTKKQNSINSIKHSFNLRKNFQLEIELPENLDNDDLNRLKKWLDLLVY